MNTTPSIAEDTVAIPNLDNPSVKAQLEPHFGCCVIISHHDAKQLHAGIEDMLAALADAREVLREMSRLDMAPAAMQSICRFTEQALERVQDSGGDHADRHAFGLLCQIEQGKAALAAAIKERANGNDQ